MREIRYYRTAAGQSPIDDFLNALSGKESQKVLWAFKLIEDFETVPAQYFKKLKSTDDIWEIRVISSGKAYRFLGFFHGKELIILTNAFSKKTQKTPRKKIELAQQRKHDYLKRQGKP
jgi:phage-related protein